MHWIDPPLSSPKEIFTGVHPLVAQTLQHRGFLTPEAISTFLNPEKYQPSPPTDLPGLPDAVDRLKSAISRNKPICIWGDFDVDGQTSTTILYETLRNLGADVIYHIPVRETESHGITVPVLRTILDRGIKLLLTCDTGISAKEAIDYANSRGIEVIVTDHHDLPDTLPRADAIINPKFLPGDHPLATLAGAGVVFKLAEALYAEINTQKHNSAEELFDLAALGLVADLALLQGDVRYLVQKGLAALRNTKRLGLQIMMEMAELRAENLTEEHIGFVLGPRLNALGRLGDANPAVDLLTTTDPARARVLATQLEGLNAQRQLLCSQVTQAAEAQIRDNPSLLDQPVLILSHPSWPGGVVGIVASHMVEKYGKPAILLAEKQTEGSERVVYGSARSIEGFNITAAISAQKELLIGFGGHPMAAGLSFFKENLQSFTLGMEKTAKQMFREAHIGEKQIQVDAWLQLPDITLELANEIEKLAPFGPGNEKLVLATSDLHINNSTVIGRNGEHLKLLVSDEMGNEQTVLWWNGAGEDLPAEKFDLAYCIRPSDWRGEKQVQAEWMDARAVQEYPLEVKKKKPELIDQREEAAPEKVLQELRNNEPCLVWAEGEDKKKINGQDRTELSAHDILVLWSTPPASDVLREVIEKVQPSQIHVFYFGKQTWTAKEFLTQLLGLVEYSINHYGGNTSLSRLATATNQREATVRSGLEWLAARGKIAVHFLDDGQIQVFGQTTLQEDDATASSFLMKITSQITEANAYRKHIRSAPLDTLL